ncbi:hypothetical protein V5O48_006838 [Marasmius crinis-equi]|uniref:C3H1-type domain-containing protein n=1 Tax=Marasmius crinis-equi TaxID=585013 RepID=A0ABR3FID2_9AGAR
MIFEQSNSPHLKSWLVRTLEPICDAEPGALADYILALLQHNVAENEMRKELAGQLDEFLEKVPVLTFMGMQPECSSFIDTLFTALRSKSYLPYTTSPPPPPSKSLDGGIPIPFDALVSTPEGSRKRSLEDETEGGPPSKGPRLDSDDHVSRHGNSGHDPRWSNRGGRSNGYRDSPAHMNARSGYNPPDQRRICRDYYNQGYCSRGALCKYSHGEDAMVPSQLYMNNPMMQGGMPFMPMFANGFGMMGGGPVAAYDPHEAKMDMRSMGHNRQARPAVLPRMQNEDGSRVMHSAHASGELPVIQDLTPEVAHHEVTPNPQQHSSHSQQPSDSRTQTPQQPDHPTESAHTGYTNGSPQLQDADVHMLPPESHRPPTNGFRGGGTRGRGGPGSFRPERRKDKTLVLEKIPDDKLSLEQVNDWFKRFGTVTNVAIDQANKKALISFSTHEEAFAAWKSEDAVFNNRFVKVFWHRPMEGQGQVGQRMLAASASTIAKSKEVHPPSKPAPTSQSTTPAPTSNPLALKQQKLEQLISEQKTLMQSLDAAQPEERKNIMARLRKLDEEMKAISTATTQSSSSVGATRGKEEKEKELLDQQLDMHGVVSGSGEDGKENTEDLKAKLEKLKAEAASLGIPDSPSEPPHHTGSYRPYRGRGRGYGRAAFRGGPPRASMKLDNRPKRLLVKGAGSDGLQAIRDWYETTGQMETADATDDGDIIVSFKSRHGAEQGLAKGTSVPVVGTVQVSWYSGSAPHVPQKSTIEASGPEGKSEPEPREASPVRSAHHEEEVVASGWGGDDDGMGMI